METKFTKTDFDGFRFQKIIGLSERKKVTTEFPFLNKYPEFAEKSHKKMRLKLDKVIRYGILMYSDTIINQTIPELGIRKRECALLSGFSPNKETGKFAGDIETMMLCENADINKIFIRIIRLTRNSKFQKLAVFEEARSRQMELLIDPKAKEKTKDVRDNINNLSKDIDELQKDLLNDDESYDLLEELYNEVDSENLGIRPEEIAQAKKDGKLDRILKSPY